jgi:hypothetical protein
MMAVILKRDATGLCRCPDGSLAICSDCECDFTGRIVSTITWPDSNRSMVVNPDWTGSYHYYVRRYGTFFTSALGWIEITYDITPVSACLWIYSLAIKEGGNYRVYLTPDAGCWSGSFIAPTDAPPTGWPAHVMISTIKDPDYL